MTPTERELHFSILFLLDGHEDLEERITAARRDGIDSRWAAGFHRDLVRISQLTDDAVTALAQIAQVADMEKLTDA